MAAYSGLRAGELIALRRRHVDLLRRTVTVVEQVQSMSGRHVVSAPKSAAGRRAVAVPGRRAVAVPGTAVAALEDHLARFAEPGPDGLLFPAPEGGFLRIENSDDGFGTRRRRPQPSPP